METLVLVRKSAIPFWENKISWHNGQTLSESRNDCLHVAFRRDDSLLL